MHVLMISDVYFPRVNGVSTSIKTFRRQLEAQGHKVTLIAPDYENAPAEEGIMRIPSRGLFFDREDRMMQGRAIRALLPQLRAAGIDIVHVQTPFVAHYLGTWLARELDVPVVETYHTYFEEYLYNYIGWLPRALMRVIARGFSRSQCNQVAAVISPSRPMQEALEAYGIRTPITVLPTGLDDARFQAGHGKAFREKLGIASDTPLLLNVGRVAFEKNLDFLLQSFRRVLEKIPQAILLIAGEGPAETHLHRLARELGIEASTRFIGYLDRDGELLDCYASADAFVFASRTETQGLVLLEAMAQGVPVVSTAIMGTRDILRPQRGALVADENLDDFADKTAWLLSDRGLHTRLTAEAREYAAEWAASAMTTRLAAVYADLCGITASASLGRAATEEA